MEAYLKELLNYIPKEVILAVILVCIITEACKDGLKKIEESLEEKKEKEIKIFDHWKVILVTFWSIIADVVLTLAKVITWTQFPLYLFTIFGGAIFLYQYIVKRLNQLWGSNEN